MYFLDVCNSYAGLFRSFISGSPSFGLGLAGGLAAAAAAGGSQCQAARQTARSLHQVSLKMLIEGALRVHQW